jgi:hypothetical protein
MPPQQPGQPAPNYDFIFSEPKPARRVALPLGGGKLPRVLAVLVGVLVLFLLFAALKSAFSDSSSIATYFNSIYENQQELIHLATGAGQVTTISDDNKNVALTVELSLTSEQAQLTSYMAANHFAVNKNLANVKVSSSVDAELTAAQSAGTYDATFSQVMQSELTDYA